MGRKYERMTNQSKAQTFGKSFFATLERGCMSALVSMTE